MADDKRDQKNLENINRNEGGNNSHNPSTQRKTTGNAGGNSGGNAGGNAGGSPEKEIAPRKTLVDIEPVAEPKKKKNRPSGLKYDTEKKKTTSKKKKKEDTLETQLLVATLINGLFMVLATRLGDHWLLTQEESENIAEPTSKIIAKYLDSDKLENQSDNIALIIALGAVVVPRILITLTLKKQVKKEVKKESG